MSANRLHELETRIRAASRREKSIAAEEAHEHADREKTCPACDRPLFFTGFSDCPLPKEKWTLRSVTDGRGRARRVFCSNECRVWWYSHHRSQAYDGAALC